jgi:hypothetical protein
MLEGDYWQKFDQIDDQAMGPVFSKPIIPPPKLPMGLGGANMKLNLGAV